MMADVIHEEGETDLDRIVNDLRKKIPEWLEQYGNNPEFVKAIEPLIKTIGELPALQASARAEQLKDELATESRSLRWRGVDWVTRNRANLVESGDSIPMPAPAGGAY